MTIHDPGHMIVVMNESISKTRFKARALEYFREVERSGRELVITDRGRPVVKLVRKITPRLIIDRHVPVVAFFLLFWLWLALAYWKKLYCDQYLLQCF